MAKKKENPFKDFEQNELLIKRVVLHDAISAIKKQKADDSELKELKDEIENVMSFELTEEISELQTEIKKLQDKLEIAKQIDNERLKELQTQYKEIEKEYKKSLKDKKKDLKLVEEILTVLGKKLKEE